MPENEIYPNPTVKEVHFEIRFPNLFYIETKIGELLVKIMDKFPESKLILQHQFLLADTGLGGKFQPPPDLGNSDAANKIWNFDSGTGIVLNIRSDRLGIASKKHKTYDNPASAEKFRDMIEFVVSSFISVTSIPVIKRIGLRYIDECPIPAMENKKFQEWYNTTFPISRFDLANTEEMTFKTRVKKDAYFLRFIESLQKKESSYILTFDFDGYAQDVDPAHYLEVTDNLHKVIAAEYFLSIKEPVIEFMKQTK